jgi:hypothetical protein
LQFKENLHHKDHNSNYTHSLANSVVTLEAKLGQLAPQGRKEPAPASEVADACSTHGAGGCGTASSRFEVIPIVSFFYALLKGDTPHFDTLDKLFSTLGLLSALALSIAASVPGSVSFEELQLANTRFATHPYSCYWDTDKYGRPSDAMGYKVSDTHK